MVAVVWRQVEVMLEDGDLRPEHPALGLLVCGDSDVDSGDHGGGLAAKRIFPPGKNNWLRVLTIISRLDIIVS